MGQADHGGNNTQSRQMKIAGRLAELETELTADNAAEVLNEARDYLAQLRGWWHRWEQGEAAVEAPHAEAVMETLMQTLELVRRAHLLLEQWSEALAMSDEMEHFMRHYIKENPALAAALRFNRYPALMELGRTEEARRLLEHCLRDFTESHDKRGLARGYQALADFLYEQGDRHKAAEVSRLALQACESLDFPEPRAEAHGNLAFYLFQIGDLTASARHGLAQLVYYLLRNDREAVNENLETLGLFMECARDEQKTYPLPPLEELLSLTEFTSLRIFVRLSTSNGQAGGLRITSGQLQSLIDEALKKAARMSHAPRNH